MNKIITAASIFVINLAYMLKKIFVNTESELNRSLIEEENSRKLLFTGSFIQKWYAKDFTLERWADELQMLKDIGITEIILQSVADTKDKDAVYPTEINGYVSNEKDMILLSLDAAKSVGMKVRVGIGDNNDWWKKGWHDSDWLVLEAEENKKIVNEIFNKYSHHEAFGGWYISQEFFELYSTTKSQQKSLNLFYKSICKEIRSKSNLSIMISPFYSSNKYKVGSLKLWSKIVQNVLANTDIDILALQDSVGARFNSIDDIGRLFYYTKQATDALEMTLYADTETFIGTKVGNIPASQQEIYMRMAKVKPYVEGFVAFSINHFQNKNSEEQMSNYNEYMDYYKQND